MVLLLEKVNVKRGGAIAERRERRRAGAQPPATVTEAVVAALPFGPNAIQLQFSDGHQRGIRWQSRYAVTTDFLFIRYMMMLTYALGSILTRGTLFDSGLSLDSRRKRAMESSSSKEWEIPRPQAVDRKRCRCVS